MLIRTRYNGRTRTPTSINTVSRTHQSFKDECDVNNIISSFNRTGYLVDPTIRATRIPSFGDFSAVPTFQEAQNAIREANELFASLPSYIRKRFSNNPGEMLAFLNDPANKAEAIKLGLINPDPIVSDVDVSRETTTTTTEDSKSED